jgi:hypothetical protein
MDIQLPDTVLDDIYLLFYLLFMQAGENIEFMKLEEENRLCSKRNFVW